MENGVQALKLAASMLIFVLAISITISAFTTATQALRRIFDMQNGDEYVQVNGEYLNFVRFNGGTREVGAETIVPSMYRTIKENYAIHFYKADGTPLTIYTKDSGEEIWYLDAEKEIIKADDINQILYEDGLYSYLQGKTFTEKLGEYDINADDSGTIEVDKITKRIIAYIEK